MNCARTRQILDAWLDHELDRATSAELAQHLDTCTLCAALRAEREALRANLKSAAPYYSAPPELRPGVKRALHAAQQQRTAPRRAASWWQVAAYAGAAAAASALLTVWMLRVPGNAQQQQPWIEQAVARHISALSDPQNLIELASSDRHVVKPWFQGKLDFAPAAPDLSRHGYTLYGARLDQVEQRPAAAVIYRLRNHVISLIMTRATLDEPLAIRTQHGFSVATWSSGGVRFAAVADTDSAEIERFAHMIQAPP